jgi:hypothetical protein
MVPQTRQIAALGSYDFTKPILDKIREPQFLAVWCLYVVRLVILYIVYYVILIY